MSEQSGVHSQAERPSRRIAAWLSAGWRTVTRPPWRDPLTAGLTFVFGLACYLTDLGDLLWSVNRAAPLWIMLAMLTLVCVAQLFRARATRGPLQLGLVVFLAGVIWFGITIPIVMAVFDLMFAAVLYGGRRMSRVIVVAVAMLLPIGFVTALVITDDWQIAIVVVFSTTILPATPVWWAMQVRLNREVAEAERARTEQVRLIADLDRQAAVASERARMARDLHDAVAGHLSAIAIQTEAVLAVPGDQGRDAIDPALRSVRANSVQALTEMRAMIGLLRGEEADARTSPPRLSDLESLLRSVLAGGITVHASGVDDRTELPAAVDLAAYRIIQEALTNAMKHAPGRPVSLSLARRDGAVVLEVENEADLENAEPSGGAGLRNMLERAHAVGGELTAGSRHPGGTRWRVRAELPVDDRWERSDVEAGGTQQ